MAPDRLNHFTPPKAVVAEHYILISTTIYACNYDWEVLAGGEVGLYANMVAIII